MTEVKAVVQNSNKHVPLRMCIVTRERFPKRELARFVYIVDDSKMVFDPVNKARGRGANLKKNIETFDQAVKTGAFNRAFKCKVGVENLAQVRAEFNQYLERDALKSSDGKVSLRVKLVDKVNLG